MAHLNTIPTLPHEESFRVTPSGVYDFGMAHDAFLQEVSQKQSEENTARIRRAAERVITAAADHNLTREEKTDSGKIVSYAIHEIAVAHQALSHAEDWEIVVSALYHDLRENTNLHLAAAQTLARVWGSQTIEELTALLSKRFLIEELLKNEHGADLRSDKEFFERIATRAAAVRIKAYDRLDNQASFGRMLQKVLKHPEHYDPRVTANLAERTQKNITETRELLLPLLAQDFSCDTDRYELQKNLGTELSELTTRLEERLGAYRFHAK